MQVTWRTTSARELVTDVFKLVYFRFASSLKITTLKRFSRDEGHMLSLAFFIHILMNLFIAGKKQKLFVLSKGQLHYLWYDKQSLI